MIDVQRTFSVNKSPAEVIDYLKDFARAQEWDPGTKSCTQESVGPVGVGTTWHNVSVFKGRETELTYRLDRVEPGRLTFTGENKTVTSTDDITVVAAGSGSSITYHAQLDFHGIAKLAGPFLQSEFEQLGDKTQEQMIRVINAR